MGQWDKDSRSWDSRWDMGQPSIDLKSLAAQARERLVPGGTGSGTAVGQAQESPKKGGTKPGQCPHVEEEWLREWYAANDRVTCARCWLEMRRPPRSPYRPADSAGKRTPANQDDGEFGIRRSALNDKGES